MILRRIELLPFILAVILVFVVLGTAEASIVVEATNVAEVSGSKVCLADVANIKGGDNAEMRRLASTYLLAAPAPGCSYSLTAEDIKGLVAQSGVNVDNIEWILPDVIEIKAAGQLVSTEQIKRACEQAIAAVIPKEDNWAITYTANMPEQFTPVGKLEITVDLPQGLKLKGAMPLDIGLVVNGKQYKSFRTTVKLTGKRQVVVAINAIAANQVIDSSMVEIRAVDFSQLGGTFYSDVATVVGKAVTRKVGAGTVITDNIIALPLLVKRGNAVMLNVHSGGVDISVAAEALQDGRAGQMIKVKNLINNSTVIAKVIDENNVEAVIQ